jgi:hypothetical protein
VTSCPTPLVPPITRIVSFWGDKEGDDDGEEKKGLLNRLQQVVLSSLVCCIRTTLLLMNGEGVKHFAEASIDSIKM